MPLGKAGWLATAGPKASNVEWMSSVKQMAWGFPTERTWRSIGAPPTWRVCRLGGE